MPISFACSCGKKYRTPDDSAGKKLRCKGCGEVVRVPGGKAKRPSGATPVPAPRAPDPAPVSDEIGFADEDRPAPKADQIYQGPDPEEQIETNPAAVLYGTSDGTKSTRRRGPQALFLPWAVILGITLAAWGVMKFYFTR